MQCSRSAVLCVNPFRSMSCMLFLHVHRGEEVVGSFKQLALMRPLGFEFGVCWKCSRAHAFKWTLRNQRCCTKVHSTIVLMGITIKINRLYFYRIWKWKPHLIWAYDYSTKQLCLSRDIWWLYRDIISEMCPPLSSLSVERFGLECTRTALKNQRR